MRKLITNISILTFAAVLPLAAQVYNPKITTDLLPDYTDLKAFVEFSQWRALPPQQKATAIWRFLCDNETGLYPVQGIYEDPDPGLAYPFFDERDVLKVLNVHGHGYCGLLSPTLDGIYAAVGFEDGRIFNMRENHHCITEVFYDGGWHYYDMDLRGMLYKPDGTVANIREAQTIPELWTSPPRKIRPFYPLDDKARMYESFNPCFLTPMYHWYKNGHSMDFVLRPGETLTRYWQPQGGRWFHPWPAAGGFDMEFLTRRFELEPRGLKSKHPNWSKWTHGNALFSYSPRLDSGYEDFERGIYEHAGVKQTARGVETAPGAENSFVTFEVRSPYIIVGKVHEMDRPDRIEGAAVVFYRSLGPLKVSVSTDNGLSWSDAGWADRQGVGMLDLTPHVLRKYGYLVRFQLPPGSGLADLSINTWGQVAPVSLPRLFEGDNHLHFNLGDRYGFNTTVKEIRINLRDPDHLAHHTVSMDADYQPLRDNAKIKGEVVLKMEAKPGTGIKWFTAGGYFHTYSGEKAAGNKNAIFYSTGGPEGPWLTVAKPGVPDWVLHWHYGMDEDVVLDRPAATVWFKYLGDPGLNQIWIYGHCRPEGEQQAQPVRLTYGYELEGELLERTFELDSPQDLNLDLSSHPENRYLSISLDNFKRK
ncbi:hypothetical protein ACFL5K_02625 [Gemmatimonadota bacterium]